MIRAANEETGGEIDRDRPVDSGLFFEGDICREGLRVEIEASIIRSGRTRAAAHH